MRRSYISRHGTSAIWHPAKEEADSPSGNDEQKGKGSGKSTGTAIDKSGLDES
jgi:hypothetical protein